MGNDVEPLENLRKEFPSVMDRAYKQYRRFRNVEEVMSREVVTTTPETSMEDAAKTMQLVYRIYCADPAWRDRYHLTDEIA